MKNIMGEVRGLLNTTNLWFKFLSNWWIRKYTCYKVLLHVRTWYPWLPNDLPYKTSWIYQWFSLSSIFVYPLSTAVGPHRFQTTNELQQMGKTPMQQWMHPEWNLFSALLINFSTSSHQFPNKSDAAAPTSRNNHAQFDVKTVWTILFLVTFNGLIFHLYETCDVEGYSSMQGNTECFSGWYESIFELETLWKYVGFSRISASWIIRLVWHNC